MKIYCNECKHTKVCKHKQKYLSTIDSMDAISIPAPFELELKCPHYGVDPSSFYSQVQYYNECLNGTCTTTAETCPTANYNAVEACSSVCSEN